VIERVDPIINFNWSLGSITPFGRDYVSVRWWGKVKPKTSEPYTFFVTADDGVKVYLDHTLIIDSWHNERGNEKRATANLTAHKYIMTLRSNIRRKLVLLICNCIGLQNQSRRH